MFSELALKARSILFKRQQDYLFTFSPENVHAQEVLKDLAKFCRSQETTFNSDPRIHAALEGRREVWLRIAKHLNLDQEKLWDLYK